MDFQFENVTLPRQLVQSWFCNDNYSAADILAFLNLTCDDYSEESNVYSTEEVVSSGSRKHLEHITIIASVIFVLGVVFNLGLLRILYCKKRFFKPSWYYVCSLVVADLLVLINMLGFVFYLIYPPTNWPRNIRSFLFPSLDIFLSSASMLSVTAIAIDRVLTVVAQRYRYSKQRSKLVKCVLAGVWMYCLFIFTLACCRIQFPANKKYHLFVFWLATLVAFVGCVTITLICYLVLSCLYLHHTIFSKTSSSQKRVVDQLIPHNGTIAVYIGNNNNNNNLSSNHYNGINNKENNCTTRTRALKKTFIWKAITICFSSLPFVIGWSFYLGVQTYEMITDSFLSGQALNMAMLLVPWVVSAVNPVVYICSNRTIRRAAIDCLYRCKRKQNAQQPVSSSTSIEIL